MFYGTPHTFSQLVGQFVGLLSILIPLIFALSLLVIVWKIIDTWIINAGDTTKIAEGKQFVVVGVIALVIMSGIWGILRILRASLFGA